MSHTPLTRAECDAAQQALAESEGAALTALRESLVGLSELKAREDAYYSRLNALVYRGLSAAPWTMPNGNVEIYGPDRRYGPICAMRGGPSSDADARLICEAPALLVALKALLALDAVRMVDDQGPPGEGWQSEELVAVFVAAERAVARAEGREP